MTHATSGPANPWRGLRFSIRNLLVAVSVVAVGCVALTNASSLWTSLVFAGVFFVLATAPLLVYFRRGQTRAWWIGFSLFGWLYAGLLLFGWTFDPDPSSNNPLTPHQLLTSQVARTCYHRLYDEAFDRYFAAQQPPGMGSAMGGSTAYENGTGMALSGPGPGSIPVPVPPYPAPPYPGPNEPDFTNVAHGLWALALAAFGGWLAHWLYATDRRETD